VLFEGSKSVVLHSDCASYWPTRLQVLHSYGTVLLACCWISTIRLVLESHHRTLLLPLLLCSQSIVSIAVECG